MKNRLFLLVPLGFLALGGINFSYQTGLSGTVARYSAETGELESATRQFPPNPDLHRLLGAVYQTDLDVYNPSKSLQELEQATSLRPNDWKAWLLKARAFEHLNRHSEADTCFRKAMDCAPHYFEPVWQYANYLIRVGRVEPAAGLFRLAVARNELACRQGLAMMWGASDHDVELTLSIAPDTESGRFAAIEFLIQNAQFQTAHDQFKTISLSHWTHERERTKNLIRNLMAENQYPSAWELWAILNPSFGDTPVGTILNGDFQNPMSPPDGQFGWQTGEPAQGITLRLEDIAPRENGRSLRIDYQLGEATNTVHASQTVRVNPEQKYVFSCWFKTSQLKSRCLPFIEIRDAASKSGFQTLLYPELAGTQGWKNYTVTFVPTPGTQAVRIVLRRIGNDGTGVPAPIFGTLWVTGFALVRAEQ